MPNGEPVWRRSCNRERLDLTEVDIPNGMWPNESCDDNIHLELLMLTVAMSFQANIRRDRKRASGYQEVDIPRPVLYLEFWSCSYPKVDT